MGARPLRNIPGPLLGASGLHGLLDVDLGDLVHRLRLRAVRHVGDLGVRVDHGGRGAGLTDLADWLMGGVGLRPVPETAGGLLDADLVPDLGDAHGGVGGAPRDRGLRDPAEGLAHDVLRRDVPGLLDGRAADVPRPLLGRAGLHLVGLPAAGGARLRLRPVGHVLALDVPVLEDGPIAARADVADRLLRDFRDGPVPLTAGRHLHGDAVADVRHGDGRVVDVAVDRRLGDAAQRLLLRLLRTDLLNLCGLRPGDVPRPLLCRAGLDLVGLPAAGEVRLALRPRRLVSRLDVPVLEDGPIAARADVADVFRRDRDVRDVVEPVGAELVPDLLAEFEPGFWKRIGRHGSLGRDDSAKPLPRLGRLLDVRFRLGLLDRYPERAVRILRDRHLHKRAVVRLARGGYREDGRSVCERVPVEQSAIDVIKHLNAHPGVLVALGHYPAGELRLRNLPYDRVVEGPVLVAPHLPDRVGDALAAVVRKLLDLRGVPDPCRLLGLGAGVRAYRVQTVPVVRDLDQVLYQGV